MAIPPSGEAGQLVTQPLGNNALLLVGGQRGPGSLYVTRRQLVRDNHCEHSRFARRVVNPLRQFADLLPVYRHFESPKNVRANQPRRGGSGRQLSG